MATLMQANHQWATRPADERFVSLDAMLEHFSRIRRESRALVAATRDLTFLPDDDNKGLTVISKSEIPYAPTHWAMGQLASLAGAPAGWLRQLPSPLVADQLNYALNHIRDVEDVGLLLHSNGSRSLRAATGPNYGRIWNEDILRGLTDVFGDGVSGQWRVPGEFGRDVEVDQNNTTLYAGDRNMFVFLADEKNRIEVPNRRNGESGLMARGFFVWNSEVGDTTFGVSTFLFDYVCCNRIVWGASDVKEIKLRHTKSAPHRFMQEVAPALQSYANSSTRSILDGIAAAKKSKPDDVAAFLANRFGKRMVASMAQTHMIEEGRPIESLWDVATAATAVARSIKYQDERVELERQAGEVLNLAKR